MAEAVSAVVDTAPADPDTPTDGAPVFRTIDDLAMRCGNYCWLEHRLFELTGRAASAASAASAGTRPGSSAVDAEIRVFFSAMSARHAFLAAQWRDRLPVRAGVDADALVVSPPGYVGAALDVVQAAPGPLFVLGGLVGQILPRLLLAYGDDTAHASAVSEAPVRAVLAWAGFYLAQEREEGAALLLRAAPGPGTAEKGGEFGAAIQQAFGNELGILPAAWAS